MSLCTPENSTIQKLSTIIIERILWSVDPFHLNFCACAMDGHVKSAGSRGEHVSWVASQAHSCIFLVLVVVKTSHFMVTRTGTKDGRKRSLPCNPLHHWSTIKVRNHAKCPSFSFSKKAKISYSAVLTREWSPAQSVENEVFVFLRCFLLLFFSLFFLHLIQVYRLCT